MQYLYLHLHSRGLGGGFAAGFWKSAVTLLPTWDYIPAIYSFAGETLTHRDHFSSSLCFLTKPSLYSLLCSTSWKCSHFLGRCYVKWCCSVFPAVSLGTDDGHSSFGPSAACSRASFKSNALLCLHGPTPMAGERGCKCPAMTTVMVCETDTKWVSLALQAWDLAVLSLQSKWESRAATKERCSSQWLLFAFCNDDVIVHFG